MIIPVRCFTCSMVLADKYRYYLEEVRKKKLAAKMGDANLDKIVYLTKDVQDKTPEGEVLDELGLTKMCCRRHFLTHVDID
jgi:DNA-directed RNA polymerase subunit N (RpoN/RPB10)